MLATHTRHMRNNNLEIRIAGSSCRPQLNNFYFHHIQIFPKYIIRWDDQLSRQSADLQSGKPQVHFSERVESRSGRSRDQTPVPRQREERGVTGSIYGNEQERGARGSWFNFRDRVRERSKRSAVQFPGPSMREEQEFAGLVSGTEWERGAKGRWFSFRDIVGERSKSLLV